MKIRGLRPRRRPFQSEKAHALSRPNGCRSCARGAGRRMPVTSCRQTVGRLVRPFGVRGPRRRPCGSCATPAGHQKHAGWWATPLGQFARTSAAASMAGPMTCRGRFLSARPPPGSRQGIRNRLELHLAVALPPASPQEIVFFSLAATCPSPPDLGGSMPGLWWPRSRRKIVCNWKVCVRASAWPKHMPSPEFWLALGPLLAVRRAGAVDDHGAGRAAHLPAARGF